MMTEHHVGTGRGLAAMGRSWQGFWFGPQPMYTLGLVRIAFGALALLWTLWLLPLLTEMFGTHGIAATRPSYAYTWGIFDLWSSDPAILIGWAVLLVASIALMVGWHSRLAAVLVFILVLSFQRRDPWFFNAGDAVVRIEALLLAISPCGAALSLDQRRRTGSFWTAQTLPNWPIRLIQVQMSIIYVTCVQTKLAGQTWLDGTALSYALRLSDMQRLPVPEAITTNAALMNTATWATLLIELALGVLVWNTRARPWVLAAGVMLHLGIDVSIEIGIFSYAMMVLYVAWIAPDTIKRLPATITALRARITRHPQAEPAPEPASEPAPATAPDQLVYS
jgi:Vitamin K-dependent gamma-carboxylase